MSETGRAREPFVRWRYWLPCMAVTGACTLALAALADGWASFGWGLVLMLPLAFGFAVGYGLGKIDKVLGVVAVLILAATVLTGVISLSLAGMLCALIAAALFLLPLVVGILAGVLLRMRLRSSRFAQRWYLPVLILFALNAGVLYFEPRWTPPHPPETIETERLLPADRQAVWESIVFFEEVRSRPPMLARIGLPRPLYTTGNIRAAGDLKRCVYNTGHLVKRVTDYRPSAMLAFDVVEQYGIEDRSARLLRGSFRLEPDSSGGTRVTLTTIYEPLLDARVIWRPFEIRLARVLHEHVLDSIELEAKRKTTALIADLERH